jgi:hypothetical protein
METTTNQITNELLSLAKSNAELAAKSALENGADVYDAALNAAKEVLFIPSSVFDDHSARIAYRVCEELEAR